MSPFAACWALAVLLGSAVPVLEARDTRFVSITHPALEATWKIRFPEAVGTVDAFYLVWRDTAVTWETTPDGALSYRWRATPDWLEHARRETDLRGIPLNAGIGLAVSMRASRNRVDLSIELENLTDRTLRGVWSDGGDLRHRTDRFVGNDASRSFIETPAGPVRLSELDRSRSQRSLYVFDPAWYENASVRAWEHFWGRSTAMPTSGLIAAAAGEGRGAVGIGYEYALGLMQNSDRHHCLHSVPFFGDLEPGEKRTRRGAILFGKSVRRLFKRFTKLGYRPVSAVPPATPLPRE